ncbi:MAG: hypothetical protein ABSF83_08680 [Nitrososphaerales archaeon]|jgi:hypothetical protein
MDRSEKLIRLMCAVVTALLAIPPGFSYLFSVINHNSFYDYGYLWSYYAYLGYAMIPIMLILYVYVVLKRIRGS